MESMGKKPRRHRRAFTPEFKAEIVELCQRGDRSVGQVARDFDLTETAVREWVKQAERDAEAGRTAACPSRCLGLGQDDGQSDPTPNRGPRTQRPPGRYSRRVTRPLCRAARSARRDSNRNLLIRSYRH